MLPIGFVMLVGAAMFPESPQEVLPVFGNTEVRRRPEASYVMVVATPLRSVGDVIWSSASYAIFSTCPTALLVATQRFRLSYQFVAEPNASETFNTRPSAS